MVEICLIVKDIFHIVQDLDSFIGGRTGALTTLCYESGLES